MAGDSLHTINNVEEKKTVRFTLRYKISAKDVEKEHRGEWQQHI